MTAESAALETIGGHPPSLKLWRTSGPPLQGGTSILPGAHPAAAGRTYNHP
jgi:hypothetical protein